MQNITRNKKNILQQCVTTHHGKKFKTSKYNQCSEWFKEKWALNIPIQVLVLRQKAEETAIKLNN
jgi:hypothetical protein